MFCVLVCALDATWISQSEAPPRMWDDAGYLKASVSLFNTLQTEGLIAFLRECTTPAREHPPMMKILPIPAFLLLGPGYNQALYAYLGLIVVFCVYLFLLVRELFRREPLALCAVVIACAFPLTFGMWRNVMTEFGTATAVVAALYHLVRSEWLTVRRHVVLFAVFFAVALLWKLSGPVFLIPPLMYVVARRVRVALAGGVASLLPLVREGAIIGGVVLIVAGPFYVRSGRTVLQFARMATDPASVQMWSLGPVFSPWTVLKYWLSIVNWGVSPYFFVLGIALVIVLALRRTVPRASADQWWFLAAWLIPPLLFFSFQELKEIRHVLPSYPAIAVILALLLERALDGMKRSAQIALVTVLSIYPAYQFAMLSFDFDAVPRRDLSIGPFVLAVRDLELASLELMPTYAYPPNRVKWPVEEVAGVVLSHAEPRGLPPRVRFSGDNPYLNGMVLEYESVRLRQPITSHGPLPFVSDKEPTSYDFIVRLCGPDGKYGPVDTRETTLDEQLDRDELPFTRIGTVRIPTPCDVTIYKRR